MDQHCTTWSVIYLYDGANLIEELDISGNVLARYTQGPDEPLSELRAGATDYYEQDGLASITSLSNSSAAVANSYTYDSFGNLTASTGTITNPFQYTGREFDPESGLRYYRTRYYDSTGGRFVSEDLARFSGGINLYRYVGNSPTRFPRLSSQYRNVAIHLDTRLREGKNPHCRISWLARRTAKKWAFPMPALLIPLIANAQEGAFCRLYTPSPQFNGG